MTRRKVCVVITARPSYSRIKTAMQALAKRDDVELQLVVAASALLDRYGKVVKRIEADGFHVSERVYMVLEGENPTAMAKTTGLGVMELSTVFDNLKPDIVVSIADRFETMATAIAATYMNIPLAHIQGGEVTGSIDEKVRHSITKLADAHLVSCDSAAERVRRMGEHDATIHVTGCPSIDLALTVRNDPALNFDPYERYGGVGAVSDLSNGYVVVMQHPVTTEYNESRKHIEQTLRVVGALNRPVLWFWPNVDAGSDGTSSGIRAYREKNNPANMHFFKNMEPHDFLRLIHNSDCLIGNSSVGIRESAFLGIPVVNIGGRQSGRDRGENVVDVDHDEVAIAEAIKLQLSRPRPSGSDLYGRGDAGEQIAEVLASCSLSVAKRLAY